MSMGAAKRAGYDHVSQQRRSEGNERRQQVPRGRSYFNY